MNQQQRIQRMLEDVVRLPGNSNCADCHSPHPRWASVNLGIFLCVTCASVHRKMGTHKSRVKSLTLDEWTREQVTGMRDMGNTKSNELYNPDERLHPPPVTTGADERDSEISKYIRRKYELGAFKRRAAPALATSNAVTSMGRARAARGLDPEEGAYIKALPGLPPPASPGRRPTASGPVWSSLASQNTGASGTSVNSAGSGGGGGGSGGSTAAALLSTSAGSRSVSAPSRSLTVPVFNTTSTATVSAPARTSSAAATTNPNILVDVSGSASSTRPLQLNSFPTVPAWQNQQQLQPQATSLGQQAFMAQPTGFQQQAAFASPQMVGYQQQQQQQQQQQPMGGMQMSMGQMNGMGIGAMGISNGAMGMGMVNGMAMNPTGMGQMNGGMNGGMAMGQGMHMGYQMNPMGGMHMSSMQMGMPTGHHAGMQFVQQPQQQHGYSYGGY